MEVLTMYFTINSQPVINRVDADKMAYEMGKLFRKLADHHGCEAVFENIPGFIQAVSVKSTADKRVLIAYTKGHFNTEIEIENGKIVLRRLMWDASHNEILGCEPVELDFDLIPVKEVSTEQSELFGAFKRIAHQYVLGDYE